MDFCPTFSAALLHFSPCLLHLHTKEILIKLLLLYLDVPTEHKQLSTTRSCAYKPSISSKSALLFRAAPSSALIHF